MGRTTITASSLGSTASIDVVVKTFFDAPKFVPGVNHGHKPSGRYADVQANPNNGPGLFGFALEKACKNYGTAATCGTLEEANVYGQTYRVEASRFFI